MKAPKDYTKNLIYRNEIIGKMNSDVDFAAQIKEYCSRDILYWMNTFCYLHEPNPRKGRTGKIPFITYKFQDKVILRLVKSIEKGEDIVVEKSRDMGATWMVLTIFLWFWLFGESGNDFLVGSINAAKTDTIGVLDTLFEKMRFSLYAQPKQFTPDGFNTKIHDGFMKLINPVTKSFVRGDTNKFFATSGRYKAIFFDEFAKWPRREDELGWQSASDATPCKIAVSSANGKANLFYRIRSGQEGDIRVVRLHWREHPLKDTRWYEREKKRRSKRDIASEIDIDYLASVGNRAAENWNYDLHTRDVRPVSELPLQLNCDFNLDPMFWCVSQISQGHRYTFREYCVETTITENVIAMFIRDYMQHKNKEVYLYGDASGKYGHTSSRLSDWDIIKMSLKANGWVVHDKVPLRNPSHVDRMNVVNKRLKDFTNNDKSWEIIDYKCTNLIESIEATERTDTKILKNDVEHGFDAWSYGLCADFPIRQTKIYQIKRN